MKVDWVIGKEERQSHELNQMDKLSIIVSGMCVW